MVQIRRKKHKPLELLDDGSQASDCQTSVVMEIAKSELTTYREKHQDLDTILDSMSYNKRLPIDATYFI